jgi:hypothetical protein
MCPGGGTDCGNNKCSNLLYDPTACGHCAGVACNDTQACNNGVCGCRAPQVQTANGCVDPRHDVQRCGTPPTACGTGQVCAGLMATSGSCVLEAVCTVLPGADICDGGCYTANDFKGNPFNCGQCGNVCKTDEVCVQGGCTKFTVPVTCNAASCSGGGNLCCQYPGIPNDMICVKGSACPG